MMAPFMLPSSRATSSAVRMAKRCSSSARLASEAAAPRTFTTAKWAARRAVSRHTRIVRRRCSTRCWSRTATAVTLPAAPASYPGRVPSPSPTLANDADRLLAEAEETIEAWLCELDAVYEQLLVSAEADYADAAEQLS